jgi:hypothetical protein
VLASAHGNKISGKERGQECSKKVVCDSTCTVYCKMDIGQLLCARANGVGICLVCVKSDRLFFGSEFMVRMRMLVLTHTRADREPSIFLERCVLHGHISFEKDCIQL